jgi:YesN/AraC family two-component response regulator
MATILIVDDSSITRRNLANILTDAGHTIVADASNGEAAYKEYEKHLPDIVTMDITMPILDGIGAVKKIIKYFPDANIIMISALDQKNMVLSAIQCGARHYIIKPFTTHKVLSVVDEVLTFSENAAKLSNINNKLENTIDDISTTIDDIDKAIHMLSDSAEVPKPKQGMPFTIENKAKELHIILSKSMKAENFSALEMIVQGFLFINSLEIKLNLKDIEQVEDDMINKIVDLARLAEAHDAVFKLTAEKPETVEYIKSKSPYLKTIN